MGKFRYLYVCVYTLAVFTAGSCASQYFLASLPVGAAALARHAPPGIDFTDYYRTWHLIKTRHIKTDVTDQELFYGSVGGLVQALEDPYSSFYAPEEVELQDSSYDGSFAGIGAELKQKDRVIEVISPMDGSPAEAAGLKTGDIITAVDGKVIVGMKILKVVKLIRGKEGTEVTLTVYREGRKAPFDIKIVRGEIKTVSVKWDTSLKANRHIMVVELSMFKRDTSGLFAQAMVEAKESGVDAMVIDLRNNPGGMLHVARNVVCNWIAEKPFVIEEPRGESPRPRGCNRLAPLQDMPTVVLVNKGSASASEIMTGALQDYKQAYVIGEQTHGKGCGQSVIDYADGARLNLTTFLWKTPKNRSIHETGITPDEILKADPDDIEKGKDVQLERALQYLTGGK